MWRSARVHGGCEQARIASFFGERFDEKAADLVSDGFLVLDLNPVELALGCFPVLHIALHFFREHHAPALSCPASAHIPIVAGIGMYYFDSLSPLEYYIRNFGCILHYMFYVLYRCLLFHCNNNSLGICMLQSNMLYQGIDYCIDSIDPKRIE